MESVWKLEEKWKLSTKQALILLLFAATSVFGIVLAASKTALLRRLRSRKSTLVAEEEEQQQDKNNNNNKWAPGAACGWTALLMGSLRWSRASKWPGGEIAGGAGRETPLPLLEKRSMTWQSRGSSDSPVWQRPILMGEKCELPRFSGLILYDHNGQLLCDVSPTQTSSCKHVTSSDKEKSTAKAVRTTLRDLL